MGAQNSYFSLTENLEYLFTSGHFSIEHLVDNSKFTIHNFYILDCNLSTYTGDLPTFDVVLNLIADPDTEPESLHEAHKFIAQKNVPFINDPERVFFTSRDNVYKLLKGVENVVAPKTIRAQLSDNNASSVRSILAEHKLSLPLIVRPLGSHTSRGMVKIDNTDDFANIKMSQPKQTFHFTEFHDYRSDDGYFRKIRFIFVDGEVLPDNLGISEDWNIHGTPSHEFMKHHDWMMKEEENFLENYTECLGQKNCNALREIYNRIGLDFFGIDCALLPNGKLLVFEANPCMRLQPREDFRYIGKYTRRIVNAFEEMLIARSDNAKRPPGFDEIVTSITK